MPTENVEEAPELGTPHYMDKMFISNGVHYREVPLYTSDVNW